GDRRPATRKSLASSHSALVGTVNPAPGYTSYNRETPGGFHETWHHARWPDRGIRSSDRSGGMQQDEPDDGFGPEERSRSGRAQLARARAAGGASAGDRVGNRSRSGVRAKGGRSEESDEADDQARAARRGAAAPGCPGAGPAAEDRHGAGRSDASASPASCA